MPFISTWKTDNAGVSNNDQITLPTLSEGVYNCTVAWGDGSTDTITTYNDPAWTHTYPSAGTYTVTITGTFGGMRFNNGGDKSKIIEISDLEGYTVTTDRQFYGCDRLVSVAYSTAPTITSSTMSYMFLGCTSLTTLDVSNWNVSNVTDMLYMFSNCSSLTTIDLSTW